MSSFKPVDEDAQAIDSNGPLASSSSTNDSALPDDYDDDNDRDDEDTITMIDVVEREDKLVEEATALLGNSDAKNCTYSQGYLPRQALYSCATCYDKTKTPAALCLACSLECHENHEVYELYTKRFYRCDCGNSKFGANFTCKLMAKEQSKAPLNERNKYNHNFNGKYCTCDRRYPPDENDDSEASNDDMWQCIVCEDWYHTKHLKSKETPNAFEELICGPCVADLNFVHHYEGICSDENAESKEGNKEKIDKTAEAFSANTNTETTNTVQSDHQKEVKLGEEKLAQEVVNNDALLPPEQSEADSNPKADSEREAQSAIECVLERLKRRKHKENASSDGAIFWQNSDWRKRLCKCATCKEMYKLKDCEYLLDTADTIQSYEALSKATASKNPPDSEQRLLTALGRMNRVAAIEAIHGYNALKADLSNYLRKFADCKKVVREEDIHEFFEQINAKKRPRLGEF